MIRAVSFSLPCICKKLPAADFADHGRKGWLFFYAKASGERVSRSTEMIGVIIDMCRFFWYNMKYLELSIFIGKRWYFRKVFRGARKIYAGNGL